jgi:hypothetical protein
LKQEVFSNNPDHTLQIIPKSLSDLSIGLYDDSPNDKWDTPGQLAEEDTLLEDNLIETPLEGVDEFTEEWTDGFNNSITF